MKTALVITTINKPNKNINSFSLNSKKKIGILLLETKNHPRNLKFLMENI